MPAQKPDFAFPRTVADKAGADLKKAMKDGDPHAALNALIRSYIAESMIDPETFQSSLAEVQKATNEFGKTDLGGIFYALQARMYCEYYTSDSWTYNRREQPLEPYPIDVSEWSGDQFKARIQALLAESYANPTALYAMPLADYADIVTADKLTLEYYPTLLDFAYQNAYDILRNIGTDCRELCDLAVRTFGLHLFGSDGTLTPSQAIWQSRSYAFDPDSQSLYMRAYIENTGSPYAGMFLLKYAENFENGVDVYEEPVEDVPSTVADAVEPKADTMQKTRQLVDLIDAYAIRYQASPFTNELLNLRARMVMPTLTLHARSLVGVGAKCQISYENANCDRGSILVYRLNDAQHEQFNKTRDRARMLSQLTPCQEFAVTCDKKAPFNADGTIEFIPDKPGYYVLRPVVQSAVTGERSEDLRELRAIPVYPMQLAGTDHIYAIVVDPVTGKPMPGVEVGIMALQAKGSNSPMVATAGVATSPDGIADITKVNAQANSSNRKWLYANYKGVKYDFNDIYPDLVNKPGASTSETCQVLTDRALYHPGDSIHMLAICSTTHTDREGINHTSLMTGAKVVVEFYDANGQKVDSQDATTDNYGRVTCTFTAPTEGLTGEMQLRVMKDNKRTYLGSQSVMVSDYKMPDFEVTDIVAARDVPERGAVTISGLLRAYSGMPMAGGKIDIVVSSTSYWRWFAPDRKVYSATAESGQDGTFSIVIPADALKDSDSKWGWFIASIDATSASGSTASGSTCFSVGKQYRVSINLPNNVIDGQKPFAPRVSVAAPDGKEVQLPLRWSLLQGDKPVASGDLDSQPIDLKDITPGGYNLQVEPVDTALADPATAHLIIYNTSTDVVPGTEPLWVLEGSLTVPADRDGWKPRVTYGIVDGEATIYAILTAKSKVLSIKRLTAKKGYHTLDVDLPGNFEGDGTLQIITVRDCQATGKTIALRPTPAQKLRVECETFRDRLTPNALETWRLRVVNADGTPAPAAIVLDMYNKALDALRQHRLSVRFPAKRAFGYNYCRMSYPYSNILYLQSSIYPKSLKTKDIEPPTFNFYGQNVYFGGRDGLMYMSDRMVGSSRVVLYKAALRNNALMLDEECVVESACDMAAPMMASGAEDAEMEAKEFDNGEAPAADDKFDYRDSDVPLAIWQPTLTTDAQGNVCYTFAVPNANTTWHLLGAAWTQACESADLDHEFVASKPIMVQPNVPRFMRAGDNMQIAALILNNTDSATIAHTTVELFNPVDGKVLTTVTQTDTLDAIGSARMAVNVYADPSASAIGYRVRTTNGACTDGEQAVVSILPSEAGLIETAPFYLNPGETEYATTLPSDPGARISLTFSENPAWTIVSALPGLRQQECEFASTAASAIFASCVARGIIDDNPALAKGLKHWLDNPSDSALVSMLEQNEDLKVAMLNSTPWVMAAQSDNERMAQLSLIFNKKEINKAIKQAVKTLKDLEAADGGWRWSKWAERADHWSTMFVLGWLEKLRQYGWQPDNADLDAMVERALRYLDRSIDLKACPTSEAYAIMRRSYDSIVPINDKGKRLITNTVNEMLKNWKSYADPSRKATAAMVLYRNGYAEKSRELMRSISEFGVWSKTQGLRFPSVTSVWEYGIILEAYAMIEPDSKAVDGLRQQLIVRKQATDWGSSIVTSQVVAAILQTGHCWTVDAQGATITAGNQTIKPDRIQACTGSLRVDLSQYAGDELHIATTGAGPAYGCVYSQFNRPMQSVEAASIDDLSIEKKWIVRAGTGWVNAPDTLKVGDRVRVQLTIHAKRAMSYVTIVDERPAAFEPTVQLPRWLYSEGVGFYLENRDSFTSLGVIYMSPGTYVLTYDMDVSFAGHFSSGVATIQSQYAPELTAHSAGAAITSTDN